MPTFQTKTLKEQDDILKKRQEANEPDVAGVQPVSPAAFQHTGDASSLSPGNVLQLQRTVGNRAVEQLLSARTAEQAAEVDQPSIQRSLEEEEEVTGLPCPGSKIRSEGQGRGEGTGKGAGPIGYPKDEEW
ncbi:MAG: hypothetical protein JXM73_01950 [Anaerolineae bacterium]|nr:hypothetical protein [Anaerolineae bacterium]